MKNLIMAILASLMGAGLVGQYRVSTCDGLSTSDRAEELLSIYLEVAEEAGIGGLGCWVHHHPNGRDYVVTPHSWGREPTVAKMGIIDDAMQAITDARIKYVEYGTMDSDLYYLMDDVNRRSTYEDGSTGPITGETFWLNGDHCWMRSGVPTLRSEGRDGRIHTFAHEIGHCFTMENVPDLRTNYSLNNWFDESVAEYLASEVYPNGNVEHEFSRAYGFDAPFTQPYNAYVLWYYYASENGIGSVLPLMNALAGLDSDEARMAHLRSIGFDELFHHFLIDFMSRRIADSGTGEPISAPSDAFDEQYVLAPEETQITLPERLRSGQRELYLLEIPEGFDLSIDRPIGTGTYFKTLFTRDREVRNWSSKEFVEGSCSSRTLALIMLSHLNDNELDHLTVDYELKEHGCCGTGLVVGENPSENELDGEFAFDYYIESYVKTKDAKGEHTFPMNYYVNSRDGSMLLKEFRINGEVINTGVMGYEPEAFIWLPNKQVVGYVYDSKFDQKRAITLALDQTGLGVMAAGDIMMNDFLRTSAQNNLDPAPLPPDSPWRSKASGFAVRQPEPSNPAESNFISAYISNETTDITSPLASFGFPVGYVRDGNGKNKRLVYYRADIPNGDMLEAELVKIEKKCLSFNGAGYKKMTLTGLMGGSGATPTTAEEQENISTSQQAYDVRIRALMDEAKDCADNGDCVAEKSRAILVLVKERQDGMVERLTEQGSPGSAGTDFLKGQYAIQDEIFALGDQMLKKDRECDHLEEGDYVERQACRDEYKVLEDEMEKLQCKMAKLMGFGDMLENCE